MANNDCKQAFEPNASTCVPGVVTVVWMRKPSDASPVLTYQTSVCTAGKTSYTYSFDKDGLQPATGYTIADQIKTVIKGERGSNCSDPVFVQVCNPSGGGGGGTTTVSVTPEHHVAQSESLGYAAGVAYALRTTQRFHGVTGALTSNVVEYVNADGIATTTKPVGFTLGGASATGATAGVAVAQSSFIGCAAGTPYIMRLTQKFDSVTGAVVSNSTEYINSSGTVLGAMPVGFMLGACPEVCPTTPASAGGLQTSW